MEQQSPMKSPAPSPPGARPERERTERSAHSDWRRRRTVGSESTPFVGKKSMLLDVGVVPGDLPLNLLPKLLATRGVAWNRFELTGTQGTGARDRRPRSDRGPPLRRAQRAPCPPRARS